MRLKGKSLKDIGKHYGVDKSTISRFLKRNGIIFYKLPLKCRWCGKTFKPTNANQKYCCKEHSKYAKEEKIQHYFKKSKKEQNIYLNRDNPYVYYHDSINRLRDIKTISERDKCDECGSDEFIIENGSVFCAKCGLQTKYSTNY